MCEPSVMIAVSSIHRKEAIEATSFAIDAIKSSVAIWKKVRSFSCIHTLKTDALHGILFYSLQEMYAEGNGEWKQNKECEWT